GGAFGVACWCGGLGPVAGGGGGGGAVFASARVGEWDTFPVPLIVPLPPLSRSTVVLMLPEPFAVAQLDPAVAEQVQVAFVRLAGMLSTTEAPETALGPELETTIV